MPIGLAVSPRIFTKLMAAIGGHLRSKQVYDLVIKNGSRVLLQQQLFQTVNLLIDLRLLINLDTYQLNPSKHFAYLGARFDLQRGLVFPSEDRFLAILATIGQIVNKRQVPASLFLRILGLMAFLVHRYCSPSSFVHVTHSNIAPVFLATTPGWPVLSHTSIQDTFGSSGVVDSETEQFQGSSPCFSNPFSGSVDRRSISVGLGSYRTVGKSVQTSAYQFARNESGWNTLI